MSTCTSPLFVKNGYVSFESLAGGPVWADQDYVIYNCFKYFGLVESHQLKCNAGSWTGTMPKCEYHMTTEIVFWFLLALLILLLLLLLALIIFLCCYFCRCCKRHAKNIDKEGVKSGSRQERKRDSLGSESKTHDKMSMEEDKRGRCCYGSCSSPEESHSKSHDRSKSSKRKRSDSQKRDNESTGACCSSCCGSSKKTEKAYGKRSRSPKGNRSKSPVDEETANTLQRGNDNVKPGCCICSKSWSKENQASESPHYQEETETEGKEGGKHVSPVKAKKSINCQPTIESTPVVYTSYAAHPNELASENRDKHIRRLREENEYENERKKENKRSNEEEDRRKKKHEHNLEEEKAKLEQKQRKEQENLQRIHYEEDKRLEEEKRQKDMIESEMLQAVKERQLREEQKQKEKEDQVRKEKLEQQKRYEEERLKELEKHKDNHEKELEKEIERHRQQEKRQMQLEKIEREHQLQTEKQRREKEEREREESHKKLLKQLEDKEEEKQRLQQQELAEQLAEQNKRNVEQQWVKQHQRQQYRFGPIEPEKPKSYEKRIANSYSRTQEKVFRVSDDDAKYGQASKRSDRYKHDGNIAKQKRPVHLINSNDKYLKGVLDDDIGRKGIRNPKVYRPLKSPRTGVPARDGTYGYKDEIPGKDDKVHPSEKHVRRKQINLINSNDKYVSGIVDDSIGKKGTKNPFVYRPYKIDKPEFTDSYFNE